MKTVDKEKAITYN